MSGLTISMVSCATDVQTRDVGIAKVLDAIRSGGKTLRGQITQIRNRFEAELAMTGERKKAKLAVGALKQQLSAVLWSGTFSVRAKDKLLKPSGLLCADLDLLGERLREVWDKLRKSPHIWALFLSPTGDGIKAVVRVAADGLKHEGSFRAVQKHIRELTGCEIDKSGKDVARLCFMSYDPELYVNENAVEITPLPEPEKPRSINNAAVNLSERQRIATDLLGKIEWESETSGFVQCPGKHLHTTGDGERDCKIDFDHVPTLHCFHDHCRGIVDAINRELRSRIGKVEYVRPEMPHVEEDSEPVEPPPAPYVPPPLALLPSVLQEYVHSAAESLNVDVAYILLPLLSSLGAAIGNARSIILKRGFIQPPVIWTGIIGRSGSRKSPALQAGCFAIMEYERELMQENKKRREQYDDELAEWKNKKPKERGLQPEPPAVLTCVADDLTIEALGELLVVNPRGLLVHKDELSHWLASFDQYKSHAKGSDVARWLSLHTAAFLAVDRKQDKQHLRIGHPRVCLTGGIQPKVFQRILTPDYFERGLPARFVFAHPAFRPDKWSEATVPENLRNAVLELFAELWLLQPERKGEKVQPALLRLDADAKAAFVAFYNETGDASAEADERAEAAWCKLSGYAARLALVGQLAHDPRSDKVTGDTMEGACDLARWFGNEAVRIYAELAERPEQRDQREFREFVEGRGGTVTVRDVITYYRPLKNHREKAEQRLNALVKAGRGQWEPVPTTPRGGQPTRKFRLLHTSASAEPYKLRGKAEGCADADAPDSRKIRPAGEPKTEAVSDGLDAMPARILEL
jgi:Protein of unknown function (DUF3987)/VirE N-terminal domain